MKNEKMLTTRQASEIAGVNQDTIRRWEKKGLIKCYRTEGGHRRYDANSLYEYILQPKHGELEKHTVIYARIGSNDTMSDLKNQVQLLQIFCASHGWKYQTISDIGSSLNYKKEGLQKLIRLISTNQVERLVIQHSDRLVRFGNDLIFEICKCHNVEVVIVSEDDASFNRNELVEDILVIISKATSKLYGVGSNMSKVIKEQSKRWFTK